MDPRHQKRINIVQNLFASSYSHGNHDNLLHEVDETTTAILESKTKIDSYISEYAPKFPVDRIAKTDLAILRLAIYELIIKPDEPEKVVINEAVELAKELGGEKSYAFVNAVLGTILKNKDKQ